MLENLEMILIMLVFLLLMFLVSFYKILTKKYRYWRERGVPGPAPTLILGNLGPNLIRKKTVSEMYTDIYK